jgi:hypothetical protein
MIEKSPLVAQPKCAAAPFAVHSQAFAPKSATITYGATRFEPSSTSVRKTAPKGVRAGLLNSTPPARSRG